MPDRVSQTLTITGISMKIQVYKTTTLFTHHTTRVEKNAPALTDNKTRNAGLGEVHAYYTKT